MDSSEIANRWHGAAEAMRSHVGGSLLVATQSTSMLPVSVTIYVLSQVQFLISFERTPAFIHEQGANEGMSNRGDEERGEAPNLIPDLESLETIRIESRDVVEEQLRMLREIDNKAIATTRIIAILLGLLLSAASLADDPLALTNPTVVLGGGLLIVAFVLGTLSFSVDRPAQGLGPGYFDDELMHFQTDQEVLSDLLVRYADWIDENITHIENNANYLLISQASLIIGLVLIAVGVTIEVGLVR